MLVMMTCLLAQTTTASAQRKTAKTALPKVTLRNIGMAKVSLAKGGLRRTIDLSEEVVGCRYVPGPYKATLTKRGCAAYPASFKLIDAITKSGKTYLVVLSEAADNCNVCGRCGASDALALIWLELDASLRLRNKRSVPIQDCMAFIDLVGIEAAVKEPGDTDDFSLRFKNDILSVSFEKRIFEDSDPKAGYQFSRLEYNRKGPGQGFVVTAEIREKSSHEIR